MTAKSGMNWPIAALRDLAEFRNGVNYTKDNFGHGVKVVGVKDFQTYTKPRFAELEEINPEGVVTERNILRHGDIVFVRSNGNRELIGRSLFIANPPEAVTHSAFTIRLRFISAIADPQFYAYVFRSPQIRHSLTAFGGGTNISNLNQDILSRLEVPLPPLPIQRRIAGILSAYDDLIENNTRRIQILEKMAQAIYREWFVHFRFPGHEKVKLVDSPMGRIPQGWLAARLAEIVEIERVGITPASFPDEEFQHFSIPAFDAGMRPAIERGRTILSAKHLLEPGCVLLSKLNPRIPRVWLATPRGERRAITSTEFLVLRPKPIVSREFVYETCTSNGFADRIAGLAIGTSTSHQRVKPESLLEMLVIVPDRNAVALFTEIVAPMLGAVESLRVRCQNLRRTRDLLLPKLISGEILVEDGHSRPR